jgi:serine phosphatase RsbU (regulator of sigma subunit)
MFPHTRYETAAIDVQSGDIVAIVTDGLTEIFDGEDQELGDRYIESTLTRLAVRPLAEVADGIFQAARAFGKATDDQTLLLLRRSEVH